MAESSRNTLRVSSAIKPNTQKEHILSFYLPRHINGIVKQVLYYHYETVYELCQNYFTKTILKDRQDISFLNVESIQFKTNLRDPEITIHKKQKASASASASVSFVVPETLLVNGILPELMMRHIEKDVYTRLSVREIELKDGRKIHIVGVYAIRDIPKGINPFKTLMGDCFGENPVVYIPNNDGRLQQTRSFLNEFFIGNASQFALPILGPNSISVVYFMNHSDTPNMTMEETEECQFKIYKTRQAIPSGTELTLDYREFISPNQGLTLDFLQKQLDPGHHYLF
jgi:hypothetical protein